MIQQQFAYKVTNIVKTDSSLVGLAVAGSWLTNEIDEFSDLDLIIVTKEKITGSKENMFAYASQYGTLLSAFTGEHVGEPRLLICLYDSPLLHVDIKFVTIDEFRSRIETPTILADTENQLQQVIDQTTSEFPYPDYQWIEDRFWVWIHYALLKIGRGEYFEAMDFFGYLRLVVLGPLLHIKNGNLPRGVRRVESQLPVNDLSALKLTMAEHNKLSLLTAIENTITLYRSLRENLFGKDVLLHTAAEEKVLLFLEEIEKPTI
ncbi:nucleotidyltransferase domain-containing protein [Chitinophaga oryziterrae]|uniref:Nucleotidyltransferase domain-containing protein n=1 Tax=Chitinophaga oryziterrae TaxID=1031224 RepID=A0A6N8J7B8_9BACT|nr:nucleotidyltransferase domain-containing protein [Chitinophaga oryziterrae]MVT40814.1 nucleotidyltransferase domain-containing protein [Chitinophaga oryziterrae]